MFLLKRKLSSIYLCIHRHKKAHCLFASVPWTSLRLGADSWSVILTSTGSPRFPAPAQDCSSVVIALCYSCLWRVEPPSVSQNVMNTPADTTGGSRSFLTPRIGSYLTERPLECLTDLGSHWHIIESFVSCEFKSKGISLLE